MDQSEYENKRIEIINKFTKEFSDKNKWNPFLVNIVERLISKDDPYSIIEALIQNQEKLINNLHDLATNQPPRPIIIDNDEYLKLLRNNTENQN